MNTQNLHKLEKTVVNKATRGQPISTTARGHHARLEFFSSSSVIFRQCSCHWIVLKRSRATLSKKTSNTVIIFAKNHNGILCSRTRQFYPKV